ncbi:DsbA family oxidoreductase [Echinicola jeungdonensis]|uniref:DsbA family oxidoreductase n=1 Tax=Echinicola jeungdonensis TaxID=709343 RepID=A0ABV5J0L9_9BACT|nr:DsbA family oxidoreductase [Echinicola jeungdonensis]MDN3667807.1 DsbA family oxidoreductase [Echinicola jeungdonensis]
MKIEIWSDIMCPFCYIGKRRLEAALEEFPHKNKVEVEWKSFLLNPDMKTDPVMNIAQYLAETKGMSVEEAREAGNHVAEMAKEEGLDYDFDKVVVANPKVAHRLLQFAKLSGKGDEMKERLFYAYFTEGANIDDEESLIGLAKEVGLDTEKAKEALSSVDFEMAVKHDVYESQQLGVRGVPFFVMDQKYGVSGAQPKETFTQALESAWKSYEQSVKDGLAFSPEEEGKSCGPDSEC